MSIALVTTRGFGNGTLIGSLTKLVTVGFAISTIIPPIPPVIPVSDGGLTFGVLGDGINTNGKLGNGIATDGVMGYNKVSRGSL
jgi:hypothetical protein